MRTSFDLEREKAWEMQLVREGETEFLRSEERSTLETSKVRRKLLDEIVNRMVPIIKEYAEDQTFNVRRASSVRPIFMTVEPHVLAERTVRVVLTKNAGGDIRKIISTAKSVGEVLIDEVQFLEARKLAKAEMKEHKEALGYTPKSQLEYLIEERKTGIHRNKKYRLQSEVQALIERAKTSTTPQSEAIAIGAKMIAILCKACPEYFQASLHHLGAAKTYHTLQTLPALYARLDDIEGSMSISCPNLKPMLIEPNAWEPEDGSFTGGYIMIKKPLVMSSGQSHIHTKGVVGEISDTTLNAIKHLQNTPWVINHYVYEVMAEARYKQDDLEGALPNQISMKDIKRVEEETYSQLSEEERKDLARDRHKDYVYNAWLAGKFNDVTNIHALASSLLSASRFYFPHSMDFRSRLYPIPVSLTPQSGDLAKGNLMFADGVPLGEDGLRWLAVRIAGDMDQDKVTFDERVQIVMDMDREIHRWVEDPLKHRGWMEFKKPFSLLAGCHEWVRASKDPTGFLSHLPVNMDGACNGTQILSLLGRDQVGAEATNCTMTGGINDLYQDVADRCYARAKLDDPNEVIAEWLVRMKDPKTRRDIVKRSVMTTPYGVTEAGIRAFMQTDKHTEGMSDPRAAGKYMQELITDSLDGTMSTGRKLQAYFSDVAKFLSGSDIHCPMSWDTPVGTKISQGYIVDNMKQIETALGRITIIAEAKSKEYSKTKSRNSASPNVVHSIDAALLQDVTCKMHLEGIRSFAMIHDSFGTHAAYVPTMRQIIKQSVYDMFKGNYLEDWKSSVEAYSHCKLPPLPKQGTFNIEEVLEAEYMFA